MKIKSMLGLAALLAMTAACKKGGVKTTESGLKYQIHTKNEGAKPKIGDFMTLHVVYKTEKDSVFFDTRKYTKPIKVPLMKPSYKGSFEEGLAMLGAGDSATFLVSADSVFTKVFMAPQLPPFIKKGSEMKIIVKVLDIETKAEVEKEVKQSMDKKKEKEALDLSSYISTNKITIQPTASGLYFIPTTEGKGAKIESGKTVTVNYVGKFLNGQEFDASAKHKAPFEFKVGSGQVIPAWDEAISNMKVGGKASIVVPSKLAYGERGVPNEQSGTYIIAPFTPLVFDVEVVSVK
jgi:FKBP-type peptidyl-prolyl cis-trans isomerase FkpA